MKAVQKYRVEANSLPQQIARRRKMTIQRRQDQTQPPGSCAHGVFIWNAGELQPLE
jgi:hypothetical protein